MRSILAALLILVVLAASAGADGVVVPSRAVVGPVRTPDQRALVTFDGTTETLVVETTLEGDGREFAWIVPLPAVPKVEASTTGLFPTLEVLTSPRVEDNDPKEWCLPLAIAVALAAAFFASRKGGVVVVLLTTAMTFYLTFAILSIHLLSTDAKGAPSAAPVELRRERVGAFDVATIDPGNGAGLRRWLDEHGFAAPPAVDAVATDYARRGWVFVAAKLTSDGVSTEVRRVHPLAFTFPAKEAVYPMRLTLAANAECAVELFVFHAGTATADWMQPEYSGPLNLLAWYADERPHREIALRARGKRTLTKLVGTLHAATTRDDLVLRFDAQRLVERVFLTPRVAGGMAAEPAIWVGIVVGLAASIVAGLWRRGPARLVPRWRVLAFASGPLAAAIVFFAILPTIPVVPDGTRRVYEEDVTDLGENARHAATGVPIPDVASARRWMADFVARLPVNSPDEPRPREEDSPGNYTIRETDGRLEIVTYDGSGRETATDLRAGR